MEDRSGTDSKMRFQLEESFVVRLLNRGPRFWTVATLALALGLGAIDYLTGREFALSLLYALPVAVAAWFAGFRRAAAVALLSCGVWLAVEYAQGVSPQPSLTAFNAGRRLAIFLGTAYLLSALRTRLEKEAHLARTDFLTGIGNARCFYDEAAVELARSSRYGRPFTVVYLDVDDFKSINDLFGHDKGDAVLQGIATTMKRSLRSIDRMARMGGDEFCLLLPETGLEAARATLERLREAWKAASPLKGRNITLTMGALVCTTPPRDVEQMLSLADRLLLSGKREGKDTVKCEVYDGST